MVVVPVVRQTGVGKNAPAGSVPSLCPDSGRCGRPRTLRKYSPTWSLISREVDSARYPAVFPLPHAQVCVRFASAQTLQMAPKVLLRHGEIVNGDPVFLIQHLTQTGKRVYVVHIQIAEIETSGSGYPTNFIIFSFMKVSSASRTTCVCVLVLVGALLHPGYGYPMKLARLSPVDTGKAATACKIIFAPKMTSHMPGCLRYRHVILSVDHRASAVSL